MEINRNATAFPDLNIVLVELTERARVILGDNFVGAYLQGSFAVGDADIASDCDFLIPVRGPFTADQEQALRDMHREFPARPEHWAQHLEGSYPPAEELRTLDALGQPWLYIDHGMSEMEWSPHCNTEVVRWSLRECGVTLAGPDPKTLVDEVSADTLRANMRELARTFMPRLYTWMTLDIAWGARYTVTTYCRILHTLESGRITSKKAALLWGLGHLEPKWQPLLQHTLDNRMSQWDAPTDPNVAAETRAFATYAEACVASWPA